MIIYAKFEDDGYEFKIPLSRIVKYLKLTEAEFEEAVKEAIKRI